MKDLEQLLEKAYQKRLKNFGKELHLYYPSFSYHTSFISKDKPRLFPSISITGTVCTLNCEHCRGKLLQTMTPAITPQGLRNFCFQIYKKGGKGCLISGGCTPEGSVPLDRFIDAFRDIKKETDLKLVVHTGLASVKTLRRLVDTGVDVVSLDVIGSEKVLREIYHLHASIKDFEMTMRLMSSHGLNFVPHILVGLYHGRIMGEEKALEIALKNKPSALVFIIFTPFKDTPLEKDGPPPINDVIKLITTARIEAPHIPIVLGCVRPKKSYREKLDLQAIQAGVNGIAYPSKNVYTISTQMGLKPINHDTCCSLIYSNLKDASKVSISL